ncbi:MAG: ferritin family protein [Anaerolineae bacterium]|nr:ferritin family protein [Anaerolineae bacterium]
MTEQNLDMLDAIKIAMEAEKQASAFYADAAQKTETIGRKLLEQRADFERHHYDILAELEQSLHNRGAFIGYEGRELAVPAPSEAQTTAEPDKMSMMGIITTALEIETEAEKRYTALAGQTSDPDGKAMFKKLAEEEHKHHAVLSKAYWSLSDHGTWMPPTQ